MPTGSGKSIAYELPPIYQGQLTLVAMPYKIIVNQAERNAKRYGVSARVWRSNTPKVVGDVRLLIVPYECLVTDQFLV